MCCKCVNKCPVCLSITYCKSAICASLHRSHTHSLLFNMCVFVIKLIHFMKHTHFAPSGPKQPSSVCFAAARDGQRYLKGSDDGVNEFLGD